MILVIVESFIAVQVDSQSCKVSCRTGFLVENQSSIAEVWNIQNAINGRAEIIPSRRVGSQIGERNGWTCADCRTNNVVSFINQTLRTLRISFAAVNETFFIVEAVEWNKSAGGRSHIEGAAVPFNRIIPWIRRGRINLIKCNGAFVKGGVRAVSPFRVKDKFGCARISFRVDGDGANRRFNFCLKEDSQIIVYINFNGLNFWFGTVFARESFGSAVAYG